MGRWAEKYTQAQREAVGAAMLDTDPLLGRNMTALEATDRLNRGLLGVPAPAQPMPKTSAYDCRNSERKRRAGHELSPLAKQALDDPQVVAGQLRQRALSVHENLLRRLELSISNGKPDLRLYAVVMRNQVQVEQVLKAPKPPVQRSTSANPAVKDAPPPAEPNYVSDLLAQHRKTSRGLTVAQNDETRH